MCPNIGSELVASTRGCAVDGPGPCSVRCGTDSGVVGRLGRGIPAATASGKHTSARRSDMSPGVGVRFDQL